MNNYTPSQKARIDFIAYHHYYLPRKAEGYIGKTEEEEARLRDDDWEAAEDYFAVEELRRNEEED